MSKTLACFLLLLASCSDPLSQTSKRTLPGAHDLAAYLPLLTSQKVGLCVNHSSLIEDTHLVDTLLKLAIDIDRVFTPEHGFKGTASDGESIQYDQKIGPYELISLYGKAKKPTPEQMQGLDIMVFDIQDVGARFYTYISTLHYVMEACAENDVPLVLLDRPNPNSSYVDGPVLDTAFRSFVGMHPIPIVHGMTIGELARMINGEGWLQHQTKCSLTIVPVKNWNHSRPYALPVPPSPNLPNALSIALYPSLCLFEGTLMSVGRGTPFPFQQIGHPDYPDTRYAFTPISLEGAKWPPYEDQKCFGVHWKEQPPRYRFSLAPLLDAYTAMPSPDFFNAYFNKLAGTDLLQKQIQSGLSEADIRATWQKDLNRFKRKREKYLLYE